ncbi:hypothetical protein OH687_07630 [Burkholderia anthina]|nr:hypothetical protein OH687_07630 [Burkholderia anthina]
MRPVAARAVLPSGEAMRPVSTMAKGDATAAPAYCRLPG